MMEMIGYLAAFCTTLAFLPQALKTIKTRDTKALSLSTYCLLNFGICMWIIYGWYINDGAILIANSVTLMLTMTILLIKLHNRLRKQQHQSI